MKREGQFSRVYLRRWVANFTSSLSKVPRTVTCLPSILRYQGASVGRVTSPCFFSPPPFSLQRPSRLSRGGNISRAWLDKKQPRVVSGIGSGCMPREEDRREGRCSLRSLTPRYNGAGCTGKIMAVKLWTDSIGFHLSSSFLVAALHRDISLPFAFLFSPTRCLLLFPSIFFSSGFLSVYAKKSEIAI